MTIITFVENYYSVLECLLNNGMRIYNEKLSFSIKSLYKFKSINHKLDFRKLSKTKIGNNKNHFNLMSCKPI